MGLKDILNKLRHKKDLYNEMKSQDRAVEKVEQSKLTAEERALNKILEKQRQEQIKAQLKEHWQQEDDDYWHKDIITQPNIFKGGNKLLTREKVLSKQKNIFCNQKNIIKQRRLFA